MTKLLALYLIFTSLLVVGHCTVSESDVIVKDGHRVVVVEYDQDGKTNTRVLITPPEKEAEEVFGNAKKRAIETASYLPAEEEREGHVSPREFIRDAIRKCKHKMASVLRVVNDPTASETAQEAVSRAARDVEETLAHDALFTQEKVAWKAHKAQNAWERGKNASRRLGTVVAEALKLTKIGSVVSLMGIATAYGMCVWVTVVSRYLLASVLGRQQSDVVQSKVYPVYFKAISVAILLGLLGHVISRRRKVLTDALEMWQAVNLLSSILMVEANASFVESRAIKTLFELIKAEKEDGRGLGGSESSETAARTSAKKVLEKTEDVTVKQRLAKLTERLSRLNSYSWRLNILTLMSLTWHFVYLGHRLSLTC
ncbi:hypothetical protein AALP_AA1G246500 [Arabis alpina]|uniref:TMEM205-like domain-containing protein n=1 Tax=Arabis alpina TaxID=50452 RepID=A0A087HQF1_ARAAL|nr:hypothetical protein AALP_AA1G246500 [Arabis alpina]